MDDSQLEQKFTEIEKVEPSRSLTYILIGLLGALTTAVIFDVGVYHGYGFTGWAFFLIGSLFAYLTATLKSQATKSNWIIAALLFLLAMRLLWLGTPFQCFVGLVLLAVYGMTRNGSVPYLSRVIVYCIQCHFAILESIRDFYLHIPRSKLNLNHVTILKLLLPIAAVVVFGGIFIAANPDLVKWTEQTIISMVKWIKGINPDEFVLMSVVFWIAAGQLLPWTEFLRRWESEDENERHHDDEIVSAQSDLYEPFRNTLVAVCGLFLVYLTFEFRTLWFREFPQGFYYAGYAHQGAAWLTLALALATALLSLIFQGSILNDPRLQRLRRLAWGWSAANMLLALAVYNRMWIYINFNGMTRMRVVGLFGITTVIVGFLIVIWKIRTSKSFFWLIHRQLWALVLALYLLVVTPVDYLIHTYNADQILKGNLAPAVQITEHPVDLSGWLALVPLLECEDEIIRAGIQEQLSTILWYNGYLKTSRRRIEKEAGHWTAYQIVRQQLLNKLKESDRLKPPPSKERNSPAWDRLKEYAYQWY